jgi:hypothetical protein
MAEVAAQIVAEYGRAARPDSALPSALAA